MKKKKKKYGYEIGSQGEGVAHGIIELTKKERKIVAFACNRGSWKLLQEEDYCGYMWIAKKPSYVVEEEVEEIEEEVEEIEEEVEEIEEKIEETVILDILVCL